MLAAVVLGALRRAVRAAADGWLARTLRPVADGRRHRRAGQLRGALHPVPRSGREGTGDEGGASSPRRRPTPIRARRRPRPHSGSRGALRSMEPALLASFAAAVVAFGIVSRRMERGVVSPPMVFAELGFALGKLGVARFRQQPAGGSHRAHAGAIDLAYLRLEGSLPARLLGIGLPLTVAAGPSRRGWSCRALGSGK